MSSPEFPIPLGELDAGGKPYNFPIRSAWLAGALEDTDAKATGKDGRLDVRASKSGADVIVHGTVVAEVSTPCARCLGPADVTVNEKVSYLFAPKAAVDARTKRDKNDEISFEDEEADIFPFSGDIVVLDDVVRDEILLAIPMIPLCSEDCPGIAPTPAIASPDSEKALDPRLAPLLELASRNKANKE